MTELYGFIQMSVRELCESMHDSPCIMDITIGTAMTTVL